MVQQARTFRIFVSSTFSDLKEERNALQQYVFPRLRELCMRHGTRFQAVDLRWGVSEEAGLDQQTMNICLGEIERCRKVSPRPNFIVLLGDRYGWRPLPPQIPASEFKQILEKVSPEERELLLWDDGQPEDQKGWYRRDDNAVPPEYILQPRTGEYQDYDRWSEIEQKLHAILLEAIAGQSLEPHNRLKYEASATEQEIWAGALRVEDANEHVGCFFRSLHVPQPDGAMVPIYDSAPGPSMRDFVDLAGNGSYDSAAHERLESLKDTLRKLLPGNAHDYESEWTGAGITSDYIGQLPEQLEECLKMNDDPSPPRTLCVDVWRWLSRTILREIGRLEQVDPLDSEISAHAEFGRERAKHFVGRVDILSQIASYLESGDNRPLVIWGESGSGKSALLARAVEQARERYGEDAVVIRFIGATPDSTNGRSLLEGLCRQISRRYGADERSIPTDYRDLVQELPKLLALVTGEKPLFLFVDALDQLSSTDNARNLIWLPRELPDGIRLVVSTLPGECQQALRTKLPSENLLELSPLPLEAGAEALDLWLKEVRRRLTKEQMDEVLGKFATCALPFYLKLAFEEARRWKSYDHVPVRLGSDIPGIIQDMLGRLSTDANHGEVLVSHALGYLGAAKNGLTEDEILDVLTLDISVVSDFKRRSPKSPGVRQLPVVVWSRLHLDLEPYLTELGADGTSLLTFYHRQLRETVVERYLRGDEKQRNHRDLAAYFGEKPLWVESTGNRFPDHRKVSELAFHQTYGEMWTELERTMTDLEFIEAKCAAGMTNDLLADYYRLNVGRARSRPVIISDAEPAGTPKLPPTIGQFADFVSNQARVLRKYPSLTFQQAYNWPDGSSPALAAEARWLSKAERRPWLRWNNKPTGFTSEMASLEGHWGPVSACACSPDGRHIASASQDKTLKIWDAYLGVEILSLAGHSAAVLFCSYSPDSRRIVSASSDKTLKIWDADSGIEMFTLAGHSDLVTACTYSPDGRRIASTSMDNTLRIWDAERAIQISIFESETGGLSCAYSPDGRYVVSGWADGTLRIWDTERGVEIATFKDESGRVTACVYSPDGRHILSSALDGTLKVRDAFTGSFIRKLAGHQWAVRGCAYSPDGRRIVSASADTTIKVWDAETGTEIATLTGHGNWVTACCYSTDGRRFVSGSADNTVRIWDAECVGETVTVSDISGSVVTYSPDGNHIVSIGDYRTVNVWDAKSFTRVTTFSGHGGPVHNCAYSPSGRRIVSCSAKEPEWEDLELRVWDANSGVEVAQLRGHAGWVYDCTYSPGGRTIVSASGDETVKIWDAGTGEEIATLDSDSGKLIACSYSPDGRRVLSVSSNKTLRIWDAERGQLLATIEGNAKTRSFSWSPNGLYVVSATPDNVLKIWDTETGNELSVLKGHTGEVNACAYSPNGRRIVSASLDQTLKVWDARRGVEVATLTGHAGPVNSCSYFPDGQIILSADVDGTVKIWDAETADNLATFVASSGAAVRAILSPDGAFLAMSDSVGTVYTLNLEGITLGPTVVTPWRFALEGHTANREASSALSRFSRRFVWPTSHKPGTLSSVAFGCPHCRTWSEVPESALRTELSCPSCQQTVRLNPFTIEADWRPIARAWQGDRA